MLPSIFGRMSWNVVTCEACGAFRSINRECIKCHPPVPVVKVLDPTNWKEEWHATRNADRLLLEDMVQYGEVLEEVSGASEDPQTG